MLREEFIADLNAAKAAEKIVFDTLDKIYCTVLFTNVSENPNFYYLGDITAVDMFGNIKYIEVKDDSRIADTGRVLCEEEVYYKESDYYGKGNMYCNCDYYCVVSQKERLIYVIDFKILKEIYKKYGEYKVIQHSTQDTYCYLVDLCWCASKGALIKKLKY